jgi:hypothetical protein
MPRMTILDLIYVTFLIPRGLTEAETEVLWQAVNGPTFDRDLLRAVRRLVRRRTASKKIRVRIQR